MKNSEIIKTLKQDISELKTNKQSHSFRRYQYKGDKHPYKIDLVINVSNDSNIHNVLCRKIQFKTPSGANKLINDLNNSLNARLNTF